ncbi:hypothetical protein [Muriicola sp.]|uniref:hypothetical protein n=1 Tax=Muriicola sp. TaxID=2020856 RepID=UPI003564A999
MKLRYSPIRYVYGLFLLLALACTNNDEVVYDQISDDNIVDKCLICPNRPCTPAEIAACRKKMNQNHEEVDTKN